MGVAYSDSLTIPASGSRRCAVRRPRLGEGSVVAGRYALARLIGEGAFGEVYAGTRLSDGAAVAIKVVQCPDAAQIAHLHEEARLLRRAQHANVVRALECCAADDAACLVMEQLTGPNLAERLERGPLAIREVLELARDALCAIDAFSSRGVLHRDLKPGNLVRHQVGRERVWKVIDFGVATQTSGREASPSETVVGTPRYMAPEQLCGKAIDVRADLFAVGALLYEAIVGECCYGRDSLADVIAATLHDEVPRIRERRPDCPPELEQLVLRALRKDPRERPQSVREMLREIEGLRSRRARWRWPLSALWRSLRLRRAPRPVPLLHALSPRSRGLPTSRSLAETHVLFAMGRRTSPHS